MFVFGKLAQELEKLQLSEATQLAIQKNEEKVIELNTRKQIFEKGIRSDGSKIKNLEKSYPVYSEGYEKKKREAGKYQGYVDLSFNGKYLKKYQIIFFQDSFMILAKAIIMSRSFDLSSHLRDVYGKTIEGLTKESIDKLSVILTPDLKIEIQNFIIKSIQASK